MAWQRVGNIRGPAGTDGRQGPSGESIVGPKGDPGERGLEGPIGKLPIPKAWTEGVHYEGDVVTHAGALWQATRDTGREPRPHAEHCGLADWICLAAAGRDARSPTVRGTYEPEATYGALDVVALDGAT